MVSVEPGLLRVAIQNLVGNAVKHSASGRIRIGSRRVLENGVCGGKYRCPTKDPASPPTSATGCFRAFKRRDTFGTEGLWLGLSIVSQAAKLMDAQLRLDSEPGRGSTFALLLPPQATVE